MVDIYIGQDKLITAYLMNALKVPIDSFYDSYGILIGYLIQITKEISFREKASRGRGAPGGETRVYVFKIGFHQMDKLY
ncbi:hypothetical protein G3M54_01685 [Bacillus megaterium NBRC 15308 = ATCC 14581]|nr:hypothetical protein [Priestia megaterium NBRC 15308 = ATCC 14581]